MYLIWELLKEWMRLDGRNGWTLITLKLTTSELTERLSKDPGELRGDPCAQKEWKDRLLLPGWEEMSRLQ